MGKCTPITQKAKSSPFPADASLIEGAKDVGESTIQGNTGDLITDKFNAAYNARKNNIITSFSEDDMPTNDAEPPNNNAPEEKENDDPNKQADNAIEPDEK